MNLLLAGIVQTEDGTPVPNEVIRVMGPGLPNPDTRTDARGHFEVKVSEGPAYLTAYSPARAPTQSAQGGATNVVIVISSPNRGAGNPAIAQTGGPPPFNAPVGGVPMPPEPRASLPAALNGGGTSATAGVPAAAPTAAPQRFRRPADLRVSSLQPRPGTWAAAMLWPAGHRKAVLGLAVAQLLVLASVVGGVFWLTRRSGR